MRLIDADKLVEICRKGWKLFGREDEKLKHWVDEDDIRNQPTVKAIPIEWINSYTTGLIFSDDYVDNADSIDDYIYCIKEMVRDWEKENETN